MQLLSRKNSCQDCRANWAKAEQGNKAGETERKQLEAKLAGEREDVAKLQQQLASLEKAREMVAEKAGVQAKNVG